MQVQCINQSAVTYGDAEVFKSTCNVLQVVQKENEGQKQVHVHVPPHVGGTDNRGTTPRCCRVRKGPGSGSLSWRLDWTQS